MIANTQICFEYMDQNGSRPLKFNACDQTIKNIFVFGIFASFFGCVLEGKDDEIKEPSNLEGFFYFILVAGAGLEPATLWL